MVIYPGPGKENVLQSEMETVKFKKFMRKVLVKKKLVFLGLVKRSHPRT